MSKLITARTIIAQLGGSGRLYSMIGAKDFISIDNGLSFRFTAKAKNKSNYVKIVVNANDLYDVTFGYIRGMNYTVRSEHNDVYAENLISLVESNTGLYLTI